MATEAATFECQMDGGGYSPCTSPKNYSGLASGQTHTFTVLATDRAGNTDQAQPSYSWVIDTNALGVTISTTASNPTRTSPLPVTVFFSKTVSDFIPTGVTVFNGSVMGGSFGGSGTTYSFMVTPINDGPVTIAIAAGVAHDAASNPNGANSLSITYDTTAPTILISAPSLTVAKNGTDVTYTVTYAGADAVTLANGNITLNATGGADGSVNVTGTGTARRTVTISNITGNGTLGISIAAATASDLSGNTAASAGPSTSFIVDNSPPTAAVLTLSTVITGTIPSGTTINSYRVTVTLPTGVTVRSTTTPPFTDAGVVTATGTAAGSLVSAEYTASTNTQAGTLKILIVSATGFSAGEFSVVNCDNGAGTVLNPSDFKVTLDSATGFDSNTGSTVLGLEQKLSLTKTLVNQ
jgi:hypothetical protein